MMNSVLGEYTTRLNMETVSMISTIKYYLKTRRLPSASFYDVLRDNYAINPKLYRNMKLASRKRIKDISGKEKESRKVRKLKMKQVLSTKIAQRVDFEKETM